MGISSANQKDLLYVTELMAAGKISSPIDKVFPLAFPWARRAHSFQKIKKFIFFHTPCGWFPMIPFLVYKLIIFQRFILSW